MMTAVQTGLARGLEKGFAVFHVLDVARMTCLFILVQVVEHVCFIEHSLLPS